VEKQWEMGGYLHSWRPETGWLTVYFSVYRAEAAIALRQRLNETVDEIDALRRAHAALEVKFDTQSKELTIARSDREYHHIIFMLRT